ncbi:MAG TPA: cytochrome d ubiquinol oxidase subunit II [bacterium]|nr:cytochrome d ubiquinol oxidase subunit II [bacterium]HPR88022.1 cytochrome d ubiquinol oxidase subunit II [bacterium]
MNLAFDLNTIWFFLVGVLFAGYAMLDGFDLGVGALHLFTRGDENRRILLNAIAPIWDGNEVWLVTGGGALFAAFPEVYATAFSGFYVAFMLLLFGLIFRAVAIEFRSKQPMIWWRKFWDISFSVSSILSSLLIGVALGNMAWGVPLDAQGQFQGSFWSLLHPYTLMVGICTVALFAMHGSIYLLLKTEGALQQQIREWTRSTIIVFVLCYISTTMFTLLYVPHMTDTIRATPLLFGVALVNMLWIANIPREIFHGREMRAFLSSCAAVLTLLLLFGIGTYPNLIYSASAPANSLTIYNAASSAKTLRIMLIIAACGVPMVLAYTGSIYWIFRGKVKLDSHSY